MEWFLKLNHDEIAGQRFVSILGRGAGNADAIVFCFLGSTSYKNSTGDFGWVWEIAEGTRRTQTSATDKSQGRGIVIGFWSYNRTYELEFK